MTVDHDYTARDIERLLKQRRALANLLRTNVVTGLHGPACSTLRTPPSGCNCWKAEASKLLSECASEGV